MSGSTVNVSALNMNWRYTVVYFELVELKYGLAVREEETNIVKFCLPRRYGDAFADKDVSAINERSVQCYPSNKGKSLASKWAILHIDVQCALSLLQKHFNNNMRYNGRVFDGSTSMYYCDWRL